MSERKKRRRHNDEATSRKKRKLEASTAQISVSLLTTSDQGAVHERKEGKSKPQSNTKATTKTPTEPPQRSIPEQTSKRVRKNTSEQTQKAAKEKMSKKRKREVEEGPATKRRKVNGSDASNKPNKRDNQRRKETHEKRLQDTEESEKKERPQKSKKYKKSKRKNKEKEKEKKEKEKEQKEKEKEKEKEEPKERKLKERQDEKEQEAKKQVLIQTQAQQNIKRAGKENDPLHQTQLHRNPTSKPSNALQNRQTSLSPNKTTNNHFRTDPDKDGKFVCIDEKHPYFREYKAAGVIVWCREKNDTLFLLTVEDLSHKRSHAHRCNKSVWCVCGGKKNADENAFSTALREWEEETLNVVELSKKDLENAEKIYFPAGKYLLFVVKSHPNADVSRLYRESKHLPQHTNLDWVPSSFVRTQGSTHEGLELYGFSNMIFQSLSRDKRKWNTMFSANGRALQKSDSRARPTAKGRKTQRAHSKSPKKKKNKAKKAPKKGIKRLK